MKCPKCGTEFEGVFCPECGTRVVENNPANDVEINIASEKKYEIELEHKRKEKEEQKAKAAEEENGKQLELRRTVRGVVYASDEEAQLANDQHRLLDSWIQELSDIKDTKKRLEAYNEFDVSKITVPDVKERLNVLENKVKSANSRAPFYCKIVGFSSLISFILVIVVATISSKIEGISLAVVTIGSCWWLISLIWWIIWRIKISVRKHLKNSPYNLMDV